MRWPRLAAEGHGRALTARPLEVRVRIGIHTGEADRDRRGYVGIDVHARRGSWPGHGGQVVMSEAASTLTQDQLPDVSHLVELGEHRLKDLDRAERLFQLGSDRSSPR